LGTYLFRGLVDEPGHVATTEPELDAVLELDVPMEPDALLDLSPASRLWETRGYCSMLLVVIQQQRCVTPLNCRGLRRRSQCAVG
jgi:hypothetical protein